MSGDRSTRWIRLVAATVASLLLIASAVAIDRERAAPDEAGVIPATGALPSPTPETPSPSPSPSPPVQVTGVLADPDTAAAVGADRLLAAGLAAAQGPWRGLSDPAWPSRGERPVYVGAVEVSPAGDAVTADVVIATRLMEPADTVVLRALFAAAALGAGTELEITATVDGETTPVEVDREGARLLVPLGRERAAGEPVLLRLAVRYRLVTPESIVDDGGPAAFGLLAAHPQVSTLGHWLPLLTLPTDEGGMVAWGDVGGFPAAVWSLRTVHDGALVTGGRDEPCPEAVERSCTWSRGVALRDVSAVLYPADPVVAEVELGGVRHRAIAASGSQEAAEAVLVEHVAAADSFSDRFGPLAWDEVDTVSVPLGRGAAGMEFPGLSLIDDEQWSNLDGAFGTAVVVHELAHQWFHGLVGNGSLSSPVVDESLAQYLTYLYWRDTFGEGAAARYAEQAFLGRYLAARDAGMVDEPPAQPLSEFEGADAYGPLVYARAPLGWVAAEAEVGVEAVEAFLAQVVSRYGLTTVGDRQLVEDAFAFDPRLGEVLQRYWLDADPVG